MNRISVFGDFMTNGVERLYLSDQLQSLLDNSDINVVNVEAPIRTESRPARKSGPNICQTEEAPGWLENHGFNMVSLANNHTMDYGMEGADATMKAFKRAKVIGYGYWDIAYRMEVMTMKDGMRIGFLACTHCEFGTLTEKNKKDTKGTAWAFNPKMERTILKCGKDEHIDYLVLIVHAGVEYMSVPLPEIRDAYRHFIDLGADAVIASHPHVPQGWEIWNNKPIFYSLGNFCFDALKKATPPEHWYESICCVLTIDKAHEATITVKPIIYHPKTNCISENHSEVFLKYLDNLNQILLDESKYTETVNKAVQELFPHYMNQFTRGGLIVNPFSSGFLKGLAEGLLGKGFFKHEHWQNNIQCESHRWAILRAINIQQS